MPTASLFVRFPDSTKLFSAPDSLTDPVDAARHIMRVASGCEPGKLYSRVLSDGAVMVWTRRQIQTPRVYVTMTPRQEEPAMLAAARGEVG